MENDTPTRPPANELSFKEILLELSIKTDQNTKAVLAMSLAIKNTWAVPLAIAAMWFAWQARQADKIGEYPFVVIILVVLFNFFGGGFVEFLKAGGYKALGGNHKLLLLIVGGLAIVFVL